MSPKTTAVLTIVFAIIISLSILGFFDMPIAQNTIPAPTSSPTVKSNPAQVILPKFTLAPIRTPRRPPLTLKSSPVTTPNQTPQPTQTPSSSVFENFDPSSFNQLFTALDPFGGTPFGGKVLFTQDCDPLFCGGASQLVGVGPPRGGVFAETRSTTLYREYDISVGNWVLGLSGSFEVCFNFICSFEGCMCIPTGGGFEIEMVGTSN